MPLEETGARPATACQVEIDPARQATAQLQASEQRLALALDASEMGLWEYDPATDEVIFSGRWSGLLGLPARSRMRRDIAPLVPPHDMKRIRATRRALLKGAIPRMSLEHQMRTTDGRLVWLLIGGQVTQRSPQGRALKMVGTIKDISPRREADEALRRALDAAGEASRAKSEFLATMGHEIRTPINGVIGLTQLLSDAQLPERERGYVAMIDSCAKSLLGLVENILDFSRIEAGKITLVDARTDLRALLKEVADVFTVRAAEKDIGFTVSVDPLVPSAVLLDVTRLRQILLNLLGNACKFTSDGGFSLRVLLLAAEAGPRLQFVVTDTGIGIAHADQERLFTRFTQADASPSRRYQGSGLGLAISRELARLMGGDVQLASQLGVGSAFTLDLPLCEPPADTLLQPASPSQPATVRSDAAILLVEDNDVNRLVAQGLLATLGYARVVTAVHGGEALAACEKQAFDLVLMDCQMPEVDGLQATAELRARGHRMPIVALTAHAMSGDRERCLQAGMDDYLTKPIEPRMLADKLHRWLTAPADPAAPAPAFEPAALTERFLGDHALYCRARDIFVERAGSDLRAIAASARADDGPAAQALAHKLRGSAATVGAVLLAELCARVDVEGLRALADPDAWLASAQDALARFTDASAQAHPIGSPGLAAGAHLPGARSHA